MFIELRNATLDFSDDIIEALSTKYRNLEIVNFNKLNKKKIPWIFMKPQYIKFLDFLFP